jgi:glycerophosphoryl diester phosphodiesterase
MAKVQKKKTKTHFWRQTLDSHALSYTCASLMLLLLLVLAAVACALPSPQLVTHRGSKLLCAENTIQCHHTAVELGADILELDVRSTKDGHLVVFHDRTTGRLCEHNVAINNLTLDELQKMDIGWRFSDDNGTTYPFRGKGYRVPTFVKFLNATHVFGAKGQWNPRPQERRRSSRHLEGSKGNRSCYRRVRVV